MDGLNAEFMGDPEQFLRKYPVGFKTNSPLEAAREDWEARVDDFDLSHAASGWGVELELFAKRGKAENAYSNKIRAYWLPWWENTTTQLTLGDDAPFFFSSELTGCRIQIGGDAKPTVLHIAGNFGSGGREWREKQAKEHLGSLYEKSVRYSKYRDDGYSSVAFVCGYWDAADQRWRILAQQTTFANKQLTVKEVRFLH